MQSIAAAWEHMKNYAWPTMIPPDLRRSIEAALSVRSPCAADIWTEVREWLITHEAEAPAKLPVDRESSGPPKFY